MRSTTSVYRREAYGRFTPIVSYCASPVPCTCAVPVPVQCERGIECGWVLLTDTKL